MNVKKSRVAILGAGVSAAYAYAACVDLGVKDIVVITDRISKGPHGAFWLYEVPEKLKESKLWHWLYPQEISVSSVGDEFYYNKSIWSGFMPQSEFMSVKSSFPEKDTTFYGYNPAITVDFLFGIHYLSPYPEAAIFEKWKKMNNTEDVIELSGKYDIVLTTFPTGDTNVVQPPNALRPVSVVYGNSETPYNSVVYWGIPGSVVTRTSDLWGTFSMEVLSEKLYELNYGSCKVIQTYKVSPFATEVGSTLRPNVFPVGRFACWNRKLLAHDAYAQAAEAIWKMTE